MAEAKYDAVDGAFYVFRNKRAGTPGLIVAIAFGAVMLFAIGILPYFYLIEPMRAFFAGMGELDAMSDAESAEVALSFLFDLAPAVLIGFLGWWLGVAVIDAAFLRYALSDGPQQFPIRLGGFELRIALIRLILFLMHVVIWVGFIAAAILLGSFIGPVGGTLVGVLAGIAVLVFWIILSLRLAPVGAAALRHGGLGFGEAWSASKGAAGGLFLAMLIGFAIYFVIALVASTVSQGPFNQAVTPAMLEMASAEPGRENEAMAAYFTAIFDALSDRTIVIWLLVGIAVTAVAQSVFRGMAMGAAARAIAGPSDAR